MKYVIALLAMALFVALLLATYWIHAGFFRVDVVFYSALFDGVVSTMLAAALLWLLTPFRVFCRFERALMAVIFLLTGYVFAISVPTVIDRSLSLYILEKIQQRGGGIRLSKFQSVFTEEYVKEHRLVDVRLTEQIESGTIRIENGCVRLTERGERLADFSRYFRTHLLPKERLLMGAYSDDLTDPFRKSVESTDYRCR